MAIRVAVIIFGIESIFKPHCYRENRFSSEGRKSYKIFAMELNSFLLNENRSRNKMKCISLKVVCMWIVLMLINEFNCLEEEVIVDETLKLVNGLRARETDFSSKLLHFLDEHAKSIQFPKRKEVVLVVGDAMVAHEKTALMLLLTEAEMNAVQLSPNEFKYTDRYDLIQKYSSSITTELIADLKSGHEYLIYPSWNRTTINVEKEIAVSYFKRRMQHFVHAMKLLFVVSCEWFENAKDSPEKRQNLRDFATDAVHWMKDINQFQDGISLVVVDVKSPNSDASLLIYFNTVLKLLIDDLRTENNQPDAPQEDVEANHQKIAFINILIQRSDETFSFTRMGIFRMVNQAGSVHAIPILQAERKVISFNLHNNTKYVKTQNAEFGYPLSELSKKVVPVLIEEVQERLINDVSNISVDIKQFFLQQERQYSDLRILHGKIRSGYRSMLEVSSKEPSLFGKQLIDALNAVDMDLFVESFKILFNHVKLLEFLRSMDPIPSDSFEIANGLINIREYLSESHKWYDFVINLKDVLSQYEVQKNIDSYQADAAKLIAQFSIDENGDKNVDDTDLRQFLERIGSNIYEMVKNMAVNAVKMRAIKAVLNQSMNKKCNFTCSSEHLFAKGHYILLSEILEVPCFAQARFVNVIALEKLFIDTSINKVGIGAQLTIIASAWEIIDEQKIILNGESGKSPESPSVANGEQGMPGKPGGPGGHFIGIGSEFINDHKLEIQTIGGTGGVGQDGGKGLNSGGKAEEPPIPKISTDADHEWIDKGFEFTIIDLGVEVPPKPGYIKALRYRYHVWSKVIQSNDGGDGGCGGLGGIAGQLYAIGLEHRPNFSVSKQSGDRGTDGKGGIRGTGIVAGCFDVTYVDQQFNRTHVEHGGPETKGCKPRIVASKNGVDGGNCAGIKDPDGTEFVSPSYVINDYKEYVRENLPNNIEETGFRRILTKCEKKKVIRSFYDISSLVNDLEHVENQYFRLHDDLSFIPYIYSLLKRTSDYAKDHEELSSGNDTLKLLYTAILSKVNVLKNIENRISIVDLHEYLEIVQSNIDKLYDPMIDTNINNYQNEYKHSLDNRISSATNFIKYEILPEIENIFIKVTEQIPKLILSTIAIDAYDEYDKFDEQFQLANLIRFHQMLGTLRVISGLSAFWVSIGLAVTEAIGGTSSIAEVFLNSSESSSSLLEEKKLFGFVEAIDSAILQMQETLKREATLYLEELKYIESITECTAGDWICPVWHKVFEQKSEIVAKMLRNGIFDPNKIDEMRAKLKTILDETMPSTTEEEQLWHNIDNVIGISYISSDLFINEIQSSPEKIELVAQSIQSVANRYGFWMEGQSNLFEIIVPQLKEIRHYSKAVGKKLASKEHVEIVVPNGYSQNSLKKIQLVLSQMTQKTVLQHFTKQNTEKLDESIVILTDIFNRIESYADKVKFVAYLTSTLTNYTTSERNDVKQAMNPSSALTEIIHTNRVLDQYEVVMNLLRQNKFPFGTIHSPLFSLPKSLQYNDTVPLIKRVTENIGFLKEHFNLNDISVAEYERDIFGNIDFSRGQRSLSSPFYLWKNSDIRHEVDRLLAGKEVTIKADITNGLSINAIKFNEIGIRFILADEIAQTEFDSVLDKFHLRMTIVGSYYYRCGTRIYYVSVDDNVVFDYSLQKDTYGIPTHANELYRKVREKGFFLSPYAMWKLQLIRDDSIPSNTGHGFGIFKKFKEIPIDLKLVGQGQYVKNTHLFEFGICNSRLDQTYHIVRNESATNTEMLIHQNL